MSMTITLPRLVGNNVRERRADVSLDQLAAFSPLPMSTGRLGDIEAGRAAITINLLWAIAVALSRATGAPIALEDLFDGEGDVELGEQFDIRLSDLRAVLCGEPVPVVDAETGRKFGKRMDELTRTGVTRLPEWKRLPGSLRRSVDPIRWLEVERTLRETDERMCRNIGVGCDLGAALMVKLWNKSFTEERDQRADPEAKAQGRGQISRKLKADLQAELKKATR
jgi:hypothetical protein